MKYGSAIVVDNIPTGICVQNVTDVIAASMTRTPPIMNDAGSSNPVLFLNRSRAMAGAIIPRRATAPTIIASAAASVATSA